jgi:hypothetical protein
VLTPKALAMESMRSGLRGDRLGVDLDNDRGDCLSFIPSRLIRVKPWPLTLTSSSSLSTSRTRVSSKTVADVILRVEFFKLLPLKKNKKFSSLPRNARQESSCMCARK